VLAGGNGAGKTTFFHRYLEPHGVVFVNADVIASTMFPGDEEARSYDAAVIAHRLRDEFLREKTSFCTETVFSHPSKIDLIKEAKSSGFTVNLVFIHLDNDDLNVARVASRIDAGGHTVPEDKIRARVHRLAEHIERAIPLCDNIALFDNSDLDRPFRKIAERRNGGPWAFDSDDCPEWARKMMN
jgi:predicted ABC-type ATPase